MSPALAIWSGRSRRRASVRYLRRGFMAHPTTPSTMKATSHNRISTAIQSIRLIEKDLLWNTALHDFQIQLEAPTTKENKMKTTLTLITIITSLFLSACANNNRAEYWNPRRAANAYNPTQQVAQPNYVKTIASGIPQRYDRVFGGAFTTTANPMDVIGRTSEQGETALQEQFARSAVAQL